MDDDDEVPILSSDLLDIIKQVKQEQCSDPFPEVSPLFPVHMTRTMFLVLMTWMMFQDWQLSQFWYDDETSAKLVGEAVAVCGGDPAKRVAFISSPTAFRAARVLHLVSFSIFRYVRNEKYTLLITKWWLRSTTRIWTAFCSNLTLDLLPLGKDIFAMISTIRWRFHLNLKPVLTSSSLILRFWCALPIFWLGWIAEAESRMHEVYSSNDAMAATRGIYPYDNVHRWYWAWNVFERRLPGLVMEGQAREEFATSVCAFQPRHKNNLSNPFGIFANYTTHTLGTRS